MEFLRKLSFLDSDTDPSPPSFLNMIGWLGLQQSTCNYKNKSNCIRDINSDIIEPVKLAASILLVYEKNILCFKCYHSQVFYYLPPKTFRFLTDLSSLTCSQGHRPPLGIKRQ